MAATGPTGGSVIRRDASAYIRANFQPEDRLAVVLIQQEGEEKGKIVQKFWSAAMAAARRPRRGCATGTRTRSTSPSRP